MAASAKCPACGAAATPSENAAGQAYQCPACQNTFTIPLRGEIQTVDLQQLQERLERLEKRFEEDLRDIDLRLRGMILIVNKLEKRFEHLDAEPRETPAAPAAEQPVAPRPRRPDVERSPIAGEPFEGPAAAGRPEVRRTHAAEKPFPQSSASRASRPATPDDEDLPMVIPIEEDEPSPVAAVRRSAQGPPRSPAPRRAGGNLEQTIGLKWAAWVGAIVVVIGVGLGIKFAYDQGWLGHLPAAVRLGLMSLAGFALLAAGEWVYRKVSVISAAGLFGAGVAVLFLVSYSGCVYYQLYSTQTAYLFAVATILIGSAVAIRGRLLSLAVLSLIGGNLAPLVLPGAELASVPFLGYLFMLQVVALVLAAWGKDAKWWALRTLSLVTTSSWVLVSMESPASAGLADVRLWFCLLYAAGFQGELLWSALPPMLSPENEAERRQDDKGRGWGSVFSLLVTAGLTAAVLYLFYEAAPALRGGWILGLACVAAMDGLLLEDQVRPRVRALAEGYWIQGAALLILAVPVTFTGTWVCLAWAVLSLALAALGAWFDRGLARAAALATWPLAVGALLYSCLVDQPGQGVQAAWLTVMAQPIPGYTVLAWLLACAGQVVAGLSTVAWMQPGRVVQDPWLTLARLTTRLASAVWVVASLAGLPLLGSTFVLVLWAWMLAGADLLVRRLGLLFDALVILILAGGKWVLIDSLAQRMLPSWDALHYYPVLNPATGVGLLAAGSLGGLTWLRRKAIQPALQRSVQGPVTSGAFTLAVFGGVLALVTIVLSFEVDRLVERAAAQQVALEWPTYQVTLLGLTILWALMALLLAAAGRWLACPNPVPWLVLSILAIKFLTLDTLFARLEEPTALPVPVMFNLQVLTGMILLVSLLILRRLAPLDDTRREKGYGLDRVAYFLGVLLVLWIGSLEIDRAFSGPAMTADSAGGLAKQMALSIYWSVFAIGSVAVGFRLRAAWLRYLGLGLFGLTLLKVALVDLSQVRHGYRILSFLGLGLLLLATSVLYGKLSPRLLRELSGPETEAGAEGQF